MSHSPAQGLRSSSTKSKQPTQNWRLGNPVAGRRWLWEIYDRDEYVAHGLPDTSEALAWRHAREALPQLGLAA